MMPRPLGLGEQVVIVATGIVRTRAPRVDPLLDFGFTETKGAPQFDSAGHPAGRVKSTDGPNGDLQQTADIFFREQAVSGFGGMIVMGHVRYPTES